MTPILAPDVVARLSRLRLASRRRIAGRYSGAHASRRYGASLDFADYREYVPGDDLRRVDPHAYARLGRLLVKLYDAEDDAALRIVVDLSASMAFGGKLAAARQIAAALTAVAAAGGDRVRVLTAGAVLDAGPWLRGPRALAAAEVRLLAAAAGGAPDLRQAVHRAHAEGPAGPTVLISDLLFDDWEGVLGLLGGVRADAVLVHLLGRGDVDPDVRGDLRLADSESGQEVEVGIGERALAAYQQTRDRWLDDIDAACGRRGVARARLVDDESVERLLLVTLPHLGVVA